MFEKDTWYSLEITVFAPEGYDFTSYDNGSITLKIGDTVYNAQQYYIYNEGKCGVVDYYFDLPFFGDGHEHTWKYDWGYQGHYRYCEVCDYYEDYVDHVWDDDDDCECDICGYVRRLSVKSLELTLNGYEAGKKVVDSTVSANAGFEKYITEAEVDSRYYLRGGDYYSEIYDDDESLYIPGEVYALYIDVTFGSYEYNESPYDYLFSELTCSDIKVYIEGYGYVTPIGIYFYSTSIDINVVLPAVADSEKCGIAKISDIEYALSGAQVGNKLSDLVLASVKEDGVKEWRYVIIDIANGKSLYTSTDGATELTFDSSTAYGIVVTCTAEEGYTFTGIIESSIKLNGAYEYYGIALDSPEMSDEMSFAYSFLVTDEAHKHDFDDYGEDATYHWKVCECGQKSAVEEHDFVNGTCVKCGYSNKYDITSVNLYLEGYKYGSYVRDVKVLSDNANVGIDSDYLVGTSDSIWYGDESCTLGYGDYFDVDTKYYLYVLFYRASNSEFVNLTVDDVTLEGYGSAEKIYYSADYGYALFALSELKTPHKHTWTEDDKVEAVPATCVKPGSIEYYVCATCGKAVDEEGKELTHDEIVTDINSDNHTYKVVCADYVHSKVCSGCGKTTEMGYHYYTDGKDDICDYEGCGHQREPLVNAEFELSGYEVGGKIKDITVSLGANATGLLWEDDDDGSPASYKGYWWCVITDIDAHFSSLNANKHAGQNYFYETTNFNGERNFDHDCFRSGVDYWLIVWIEADVGYRVNGLTNEDIYIDGLGVAYYLDTYYIDMGYEYGYAYFKLNKLEGECDIEAIQNIELDVSGYAVDALISDATVTVGNYAVIDTASDWGFRVQDTAVPAEGETFSADKYYVLCIYINAIDGYDFYGFTRDKITVKDMADAVCTWFEVRPGFGGIYVEFVLPALHEHTYGDYVCEDDNQHYKECSTCGQRLYSDHVYDDADDAICNDCGYVRKLYITQLDLTLSGYEIDKKVIDLKLSATDDCSKYIAYEEGQYNLGIEGLVCYTYGKENGSYMTFTSDSDLTFRPGPDYEVGIVLMLDDAYTLSSDAVITLDGVELTQVFDVGNGYVIAVATLPVLEGESQKTTISGAEFTLTGYEIGAKLSDTALTLEGADGIGYYGVMIYDGDNNLLYGSGNTTDEVFQKEKVYYIMVVMQVKDGYTLYGTLPTNIKINGVNAVDYSSVAYAGSDDDYDMYSYYTVMGLKCSLPVLTDEAHEHSYCKDYGYDATSHWHYCDVCGHKKDVAEHVYADKYDFTCEICGYVRTIEITSITLYLRTYTYGQPAQSLFVEHYADGVELYYDGYGYDYILSPDMGIAYGLSSNYVDGNDLLLAGIKYYLQVGLELKNGYGINNLNAQNIALDGYGTAITMFESNGCLYATFELPALEKPHVHEGTWYDEVPATCTDAGTKAHRLCDTCNKYFDADGREIADLTIAINPDAHSFGAWNAEVPATCTDDGTKGYKDCTLCGKHFDDEGNEITNLTISALGHNTDGTVAHKDADCTNDGVVGGTYCTRCNDGRTAAETVIPALGHNTDGTVAHKDADCTNDGVVGGTYCTRCNNGKADAETVIPALGHEYGEWVSEEPATCVSTGTKAHQYCSRCQKYFDVNYVEIDDIVIPKNDNHDMATEWTKTQEGHYHACLRSGCDHKADFSAHTPDRNAPTEYEPKTCTVCGYVIETALGHTHKLTLVPAKSATCLVNGTKAYYACSGCEAKFEDENGTIAINDFENWVVVVGSHDFGAWTAEKPATCVSTGVKGHKDCVYCNKHFDENGSEIVDLVIPVNDNHDMATEWTKTQDGHYHVCKRSGCNHTTTLEAHTPDRSEATTEYPVTCTVCGYIITPALGHTHSLTLVPEVPATCTTDGTKAYYACSGCEVKFEDANGTIEIDDFNSWKVITGTHSYGEWIPEVPATCKEAGTKAHKTCATCGKHFASDGTEILSLTIPIDPSAHGTSIIKVESVPATAASVGNIVYYRCMLCGRLYADESATVELDLADTIIPKIAPTIVSGANAEWVMNSDKHLTFKSDALRSDFISISVDGNVLGAGTYAMGLDGLSVSIAWTYLETLTVGEHTVEIRSESGTAVATFTVTAPKEGLSAGAWVGIGFGIAGGVAGIAVGVWFLLKYLKRRKTPMPIQTEAPVEPDKQEGEASSTDQNGEDK